MFQKEYFGNYEFQNIIRYIKFSVKNLYETEEIWEIFERYFDMKERHYERDDRDK